MHETTIELLRSETLGQVNAELVRLRQCLTAPVEDGAQSDTLLATRLAKLEREGSRLETLDLPLVFIGDSPAARLHLINACIGIELFSQPEDQGCMLPLLIRHTPGQFDPVLHFHLYPVLNTLLEHVGARLDAARLNAAAGSQQDQLDVEAVAALIHGNKAFIGRYKGVEAIATWRNTLGSLLRVSDSLGFDLPNEPDALVEWPTIEVEFAFFSQQYALDARPCFIDLPMPDNIVRDALKRQVSALVRNAPAVVAVLDQERLLAGKTVSMGPPLQALHAQLRERLSILVIRADRKNSQADKVESVRALVAQRIMAGKMDNASIFPVNVHWGMLANRARQEIARNGKLPDASRTGWVRDFGSEVFGANWGFKIRNLGELLPALVSMWDEAGFDLALSGLVAKAQTQATIEAIGAALAGLCQEMSAQEAQSGDLLYVIENWTQLSQQFADVRDDLARMKKLMALAAMARDNTLNKIRTRSRLVLNRFHTLKLRALKHYFNEGMAFAYRIPELPARSGLPWSGLLGAITRRKPHHVPEAPESKSDKDETVFHIKQQHDAQQLMIKVTDAMDCIVKSAQFDVCKTVNQEVSSFRKGFEEGISRVSRQALQALDARISVPCFSINIQLPEVGSAEWHPGKRKPLSDTLQVRHLSRHRVRRKRGVWGGVCKGLRTAEWGWEFSPHDDKAYEINLVALREHVDASMQGMLRHLDHLIASEVAGPMDASLGTYFKEQARLMESIRRDALEKWREARLPPESGVQADLNEVAAIKAAWQDTIFSNE